MSQHPAAPSERRTAVVIVGDDRGWSIHGVIEGALVETPEPPSTRAAAVHLRAWLPILFGCAS
jgi:hypothetical protein